MLSGLVDGLRAGRVLDVATGRGGLIHSLLEVFAGFEEIVGVDSKSSTAGGPRSTPFAAPSTARRSSGPGIVRIVEGLGLDDLRMADDADDGDPMARVAALDPIIDRYLAYPEVDEALRARDEELRARLHAVGLRNARELVAVGRRP